ncbi:MAG: RagB/SusD family nutrient uptake outer membrane protein [Chitinophagaceae bacterium]
MKINQYKIIIPCCIVSILIYSCGKNFLNIAPLASLNQDVIANETGVQGLLIGAYSSLDGEGGAGDGSGNGNWGSAVSNWVYGSVCADDSYKGSTPSDQGDILPLETWSGTATNSYPASKWQFNYNAIQRCNNVLRIMALATDISAAEQTEITAETRFLRGIFHFELKKVFNMVPYIDETVFYEANNYNVPNDKDIWPNIEADFQFAVANLPATQAQTGRANKYAAEAFLAKTYLFEHKYANAKPLLDDLIANGVTASGKKYALVNFFDNFNAATKNSAECIFAAQMSVNDGSGSEADNGVGTGNGNYGDALNFPYSGGPGACCGFNNPSQNLANAYKTDANGLPLLDDFNTGKNVSDPNNPYTGTLDPRIDWTIGRQGIPYLDWGNHPGDAWIRDPVNDGHFSPKKNVYALSQQGTYSDVSSYWAAVELTANNYNFIRFADILLWAAECEAQIGDINKAENYVNEVRMRAANPTGWVYKNAVYDAATSKYTPQTTPADNYLIKPYPAGAFSNQATALKAIYFERRLELAMEGHRFFDLQRWDNGTGYMANVLNAYASVEKKLRPFFNGATFKKGKNEFFAIPQSQIDLANSGGKTILKQNPGY